MKLVVFDVDGTLIDSQHRIHRAMDYAFRDNGLPPPSLEEVRGVVGLSLPLAIMRLMPGAGDLLDLVASSYVEAFTSDDGEPASTLFPGAAQCLARLGKHHELTLGVATGKGRRGLNLIVESNGWEGTFATLQCADDHPSKPDPSMLRTAMAEAGVTPADTMMIGDTSFDIGMANAAGARGIGVAWGYHPAVELVQAGAAGVARDFDDLTAIVLDWAEEARA